MTKYKKLFQEAERKLKDAEIPEKVTEVVEKALGNSGTIVEGGIYAGLAIMSYQAKLNPLFGPVALKLATTQIGDSSAELSIAGVKVPFNSQIVGLAMLGYLGLSPYIDEFNAWFISGYDATWKGLKTCDEKRSYANFLVYKVHLAWDKYAPFIAGWFDTQLVPIVHGEDYLKYLAESQMPGGAR